jgi:site-specific recombinase XerD
MDNVLAKVQAVKNYRYASRPLDFYCVIDKAGDPIFAPSLFLFGLVKKGQSVKTTRAYSFDLARFFTVLEQSKGVTGVFGKDYRDVTDVQMTKYLHGYLKMSLGLKDSTIERHVATLSNFYYFAYQNGLMSSVPQYTFEWGDEKTKTTIMQGLTTKLHETYMDEDVFKDVVLANITTKDNFLRERDRLALMLGYHAGLRTEELVIKGNLCVKKLRKLLPNEKERVPRAINLNIRGKGKKTRNVQLTVAGTSAIYDFLWGRAKHIKTNLMCNKSGKSLINDSFGTDLFRGCINTYLAKTNLSKDNNLTWSDRSYHTLRKCFATNSVIYCHKAKLDPRVFVTQWMGHKDPETTDIYIFYDAVLNNRVKVLKDLNLQNTAFGQLYRKKYKNEGHV